MYALVKPFSGKGGILWKCEIYDGSSHVIRYLSSGYKKGSYNRIWWKNTRSDYLTLKNDSHTPCNTISSMVNVCIRYVIFWTKRGILSQCEISPVGFITCNVISLCWLQKKGGGGGGGGGEGKSLHDKLTPGVLISCCTMVLTHSYGEVLYYIMRELRPRVLISRWKLTPTQREIWSHR